MRVPGKYIPGLPEVEDAGERLAGLIFRVV